MKELEKILHDILGRYDLSKSEGRDTAFEECVDFAETRLTDDLRCNAFLRMAAQMLEKEPVEFDIIRDMIEMSDDAAIDVAYDDRQGFLLSGNAAGLEYLADLIKTLAEAPEGEHIHFYNDEPPLTPMSFNAVIYHESEEWFQRTDDTRADEPGQDLSRKRTIKPEDIFGVQIVGNLPADSPVSRDKIYRVQNYSLTIPEYDDETPDEETVWRKSYFGEPDRRIILEVNDDMGEDVELVLHLDDPDVIFFKKEDIAQLLND